VHRLDNFDGPAVGEIAVGYEMFEEAFEIYKKFELQVLSPALPLWRSAGRSPPLPQMCYKVRGCY